MRAAAEPVAGGEHRRRCRQKRQRQHRADGEIAPERAVRGCLACLILVFVALAAAAEEGVMAARTIDRGQERVQSTLRIESRGCGLAGEVDRRGDAAGMRLSVFSIRAAHAAQVIPSMASSAAVPHPGAGRQDLGGRVHRPTLYPYGVYVKPRQLEA